MATKKVGKKHTTYSNGHELKKGTCRICGCTEKKACNINEIGPASLYPQGYGCSWVDKTKTLCNAPYCVNKDADLFREYNLGDSLRHSRIWTCQERIKCIEENIGRSRRMGNGPRSKKLRQVLKAEIGNVEKEIKRLEHLTSVQIIELYHEHQKATKC